MEINPLIRLNNTNCLNPSRVFLLNANFNIMNIHHSVKVTKLSNSKLTNKINFGSVLKSNTPVNLRIIYTLFHYQV